MSFYSDRFINIAFGKHPFANVLDGLKPGDSLPASVLLTLLDGESEEIFREAFDHLDAMGVSLDISDLPKAPGTGEAALRLRQEEQLAASGDLLTGLEETDPLRLYLEEIASVPVCGDIQLLALDLADANRDERMDETLWSRILNLSLSRVVETAKEYTGYGVLLLDLIQEGSMGLWENLEFYREGDLEAYIDREIHEAMARTVILQNQASGLGAKMRQALEDYRAVDERLLGELGRNPTLEEIAEELHLTADEAGSLSQMVTAARRLAQARPEEKPEEEEQAEEQQAVEDTAYFQARQRIAEMLSGLTEADAKLLTLRFGLEGGLPMSPEEAGKKLGMTPEEVVKREAAVLAQLRQS